MKVLLKLIKNFVLLISGLSLTWIFLTCYNSKNKSNHSHLEFEEFNSHADIQHDHEEKHVHKHRHGDKGEEHEHNHGVQIEVKPFILLKISTFKPQYLVQYHHADWFFHLEKEKNFIFELLRPPQVII